MIEFKHCVEERKKRPKSKIEKEIEELYLIYREIKKLIIQFKKRMEERKKWPMLKIEEEMEETYLIYGEIKENLSKREINDDKINSLLNWFDCD